MNGAQNKSFVIFVVILSFLTGILGGVGGIALVASSPSLQKSVGINAGSNISFAPKGNVENITVKEDSAVVDAVKKVSPAVVSVVFTKDVQVINPFNFGFGQPSQSVQRQQGSGSGFILTSDGMIATNKHVADVDGAKYSVITQDGKKYDATVLAKDPVSDFAILKIDAKNLPVVDLGNSDDLEIGQRVIAIGNALGEFQNSVTVGVLSGKQRSLTASDQSGQAQESLEGLLQTDAAINEGNSGGPLLNLKGQVVGIDTATAAKSQAEGLGFAIPINSLKTAIDSIKQNGKIIRAFLGVMYAPVDQKIAAIKGIEADKGALVTTDSSGASAVQKDSPADKAGIKEGDVILKVDNDSIDQNNALTSVLEKHQPNDEVALTILRDGKQITAKVVLGQISS